MVPAVLEAQLEVSKVGGNGTEPLRRRRAAPGHEVEVREVLPHFGDFMGHDRRIHPP